MVSIRSSGSAKRLTSGLVLRESVKAKAGAPLSAAAGRWRRISSLQRHHSHAVEFPALFFGEAAIPSTCPRQPVRGPMLEGLPLLGGQMQAMLGASFENIGRRHRPFPVEEIVGL